MPVNPNFLSYLQWRAAGCTDWLQKCRKTNNYNSSTDLQWNDTCVFSRVRCVVCGGGVDLTFYDCRFIWYFFQLCNSIYVIALPYEPNITRVFDLIEQWARVYW